jgi:hypothetical protein
MGRSPPLGSRGRRDRAHPGPERPRAAARRARRKLGPMGRHKGGGKTPSEKLGGRCAGDLTILQVRPGFPRFLRISFSRSIFFRFSSADSQLATVGLRAAWNGYWTTALEPSANIIVSSGRASGRVGDSASSGPERRNQWLPIRCSSITRIHAPAFRREFPGCHWPTCGTLIPEHLLKRNQ